MLKPVVSDFCVVVSKLTDYAAVEDGFHSSAASSPCRTARGRKMDLFPSGDSEGV